MVRSQKQLFLSVFLSVLDKLFSPELLMAMHAALRNLVVSLIGRPNLIFIDALGEAVNSCLECGYLGFVSRISQSKKRIGQIHVAKQRGVRGHEIEFFQYQAFENPL